MIGGNPGPRGSRSSIDNLGELAKEIGLGSWKFVAADEASAFAKSFLNPIVVENGERDGRFPDPTSTRWD